MTGLHLDMLIEHFKLEMREVDEFSFVEARVYGGFFFVQAVVACHVISYLPLIRWML